MRQIPDELVRILEAGVNDGAGGIDGSALPAPPPL